MLKHIIQNIISDRKCIRFYGTISMMVTHQLLLLLQRQNIKPISSLFTTFLLEVKQAIFTTRTLNALLQNNLIVYSMSIHKMVQQLTSQILLKLKSLDVFMKKCYPKNFSFILHLIIICIFRSTCTSLNEQHKHSTSNQQIESISSITCLMMKYIDFIMFNPCLVPKKRKKAFNPKLPLVFQRKANDSK